MAKKTTPKAEIEEAVIVEETTAVSVLNTEYEKPVIPSLLNKKESLATIQTAYEKYSNIEIAGTQDKENYNKVVAGIKELKDSRIAWVEATEENLIGPSKEWFTKLKSDHEAIILDFKKKEAALRVKKDAIDQQKKDEKAAADKLKLERMAGRIQKIVSLGGKDSGAKYVFDYDLTLSVSINDIKDLEDDKWNAKTDEIEDAWNAEQTRITNERIAQEEAATKAKELVSSNLAKRTMLRLKELKLDDFTLEEGWWFKAGAPYVNQHDIETMEDGAWDAMIARSATEAEEVDQLAADMKTSAEAEIKDDESLPFDVEPLPFTDDEELPFDDNSNLTQEQQLNGGGELGTDGTEQPLEPEEEMVETTVSLTFTLENPFCEVEITQKLSQLIFPADLRDVALEGREIAKEGVIVGDLHFALVKR